MAITKGNYIIRSALDEDVVLLTVGGSKAKGALITAGAFSETDNRCYWAVTVVSSTYNQLKNIQSSLYLMAPSVAANGAIKQNAYKIATGAWTAVASGNTMTVNGQSVSTYYLQAYSNANLYVTVPGNGGDLYLSELLDDTTNQEFYFEATTYYNAKLTTPNTLTTSDGLNYIIHSGAGSFYPQWKNSNSNIIYEQRSRSRAYDMDGNLAADWGDWTGWAMVQADPTLDSKKKYAGLMTSQTAVTTPAVDNSTYSRAEIQVQVRITSAKNAAGYNQTGTVTHGPTLSGIINQWCVPSLSITAALYSPDGLALAYATNYTIAGSSITINYIKDANNVLLIENYTFAGQDYTGDLYLNCDELYSVPAQNSTLTISATIVEENGVVSKKISTSLTCAYDAGGTLSLSPTYTLTNRLTLQAKITKYDITQCYLEHKQLDGQTYWVACDLVDDDGTYLTFEIPIPYNSLPNILWVCVDSYSQWNTSIVSPPNTTITSDRFSWFWIDPEGKPQAAILKYRANEVMQPNDVITLPAHKFITTGREYPVFRYSKTIERGLDIEGAILDVENDNYCKRADFEKMAVANHAVYRQPDGKWYQVAIKGIQFERQNKYCNVQITQEAETR